LGKLIEGWTIHHQKMEICKDNFKTFNDFQKSLLHPALKLTTCELSPLFKILQGDTQPSFPRHLTPEGHLALSRVEQAIIILRKLVDYSQPIQLLILPTASLPTGGFGNLREYYSGYI
jgi:hypothetical protein